MARLKARYNDELKAKLKEELGIKNVMEIPRITKITLNMGVGAAATDKKLLEGAVADMQLIAGQKPVVTLARKSIAGFKIRDGWPIGCKVTLRGDQMYEFLDRLISIAIPRIRDFRGFSAKSFDGRGNYSMGLKEQIVFPEIDFDKIDRIRGLDITITTTARSDDEGRAAGFAHDGDGGLVQVREHIHRHLLRRQAAIEQDDHGKRQDKQAVVQAVRDDPVKHSPSPGRPHGR